MMRVVLAVAYAAVFAAAAVGGWWVFTYAFPHPVGSKAGIAAVVGGFLIWEFVLVCLAAGMFLGGAVVGDVEVVLGVFLGIILGSVAGGAIAAFGGVCFGFASGGLVGAAAGLCRRQFAPDLARRFEGHGFPVQQHASASDDLLSDGRDSAD